MENIIKGWLLSAIGFVGIVVISLHALGVYEFPNPNVLNKAYEVAIGLIVCFALFLFPKTKIELVVEQLLGYVLNIFKKKAQ